MPDSIDYMERYACQVRLKEFGADAQQRLQQSKVLVIGAGGLGCPALLYLAAAGIGTIGIVDDDVVQLSNLHRQVLYTQEDVGKSKAETAAKKLKQQNPGVTVIAHKLRITNKEALSIISNYDLVMDGSDNFATRFMINDACVLLNKPLIFGAVAQTEGQVGIFNHSNEGEPANYRDLFPHLLPDDAAASCREQGILGVVPGVIGLMMATEAIKLISGKGKTLSNKILSYNCFTNQFYQFEISSKESSKQFTPQTAEAFLQTDYLQQSANREWTEIDGEQVNEILSHPKSILVDVRSENELPVIQHIQCIRIPVESLASQQELFQQASEIIVVCAAGVRSRIGAGTLYKLFGNSKQIYSLKGGIQQWKENLNIFS